jgi:hypothetical protein
MRIGMVRRLPMTWLLVSNERSLLRTLSTVCVIGPDCLKRKRRGKGAIRIFP